VSEHSKTFYGWRIVAAAFVFMMMTVGFVTYGLPQFYPRYVAEFGWLRGDIQFGNALSRIIVGPLFGFLAGLAIDRAGPRRVMVAGATCAGIALVGFSLMTSLTGLYVFFFFNALGYVLAGPLPCQVLLSNWFARLRGRVMGIAYVGIGVGGAVVPHLIRYFNEAFGWRRSLLLLGVLIFVTLALLALFVIKRRPADLGLLPDGGAERAEVTPVAEPAAPLSAVVRTPAFWLLAVGSVLSIASVGGVIQNLPLYITDITSKAEAAARISTVSSLVLTSSIAGRLVMGYLADRLTKKHVMLATYLIVALSIPLLVFARDYPTLIYVFAVTFGFGLGADYMLIPLMAAECFGLASLSRILGLIITSDSVGEALMPFLVARVRDNSGSYAWGFMMLTATALVGAIAILLIRYRDGVPVSRMQLKEAAEGIKA
jgi:sugar phosphate permease